MANSNQTSPIMTEDEACIHALQYVNSSMMARVIETAIDLDVFGIVSRSGSGSQLSSLEIASQLLPEGSPNDHQVASRLDSMLRLLATHALLTCSLRIRAGESSETRVYGLAPASKYFSRNHSEGSAAFLMAFLRHPANDEVWSNMKNAIIEGGDQFENIHGMTSYQYARIDPTLNKSFNEAMTGMSALTMTKILKVYRGFDGLASLVDVGGGSGRILSMIITKHPSITGINFDLPHVVRAAPPNNDLAENHHFHLPFTPLTFSHCPAVLDFQRLLVVELLASGSKVTEANEQHWSNELYEGEFNDLSVCSLFSKQSGRVETPTLMWSKCEAPALRFESQPVDKTLEVYLTIWLAEPNIDTYRVGDIISIVGEEMHVKLS